MDQERMCWHKVFHTELQAQPFDTPNREFVAFSKTTPVFDNHAQYSPTLTAKLYRFWRHIVFKLQQIEPDVSADSLTMLAHVHHLALLLGITKFYKQHPTCLVHLQNLVLSDSHALWLKFLPLVLQHLKTHEAARYDRWLRVGKQMLYAGIAQGQRGVRCEQDTDSMYGRRHVSITWLKFAPVSLAEWPTFLEKTSKFPVDSTIMAELASVIPLKNLRTNRVESHSAGDLFQVLRNYGRFVIGIDDKTPIAEVPHRLLAAQRASRINHQRRYISPLAAKVRSLKQPLTRYQLGVLSMASMQENFAPYRMEIPQRQGMTRRAATNVQYQNISNQRLLNGRTAEKHFKVFASYVSTLKGALPLASCMALMACLRPDHFKGCEWVQMAEDIALLNRVLTDQDGVPSLMTRKLLATDTAIMYHLKDAQGTIVDRLDLLPSVVAQERSKQYRALAMFLDRQFLTFFEEAVLLSLSGLFYTTWR